MRQNIRIHSDEYGPFAYSRTAQAQSIDTLLASKVILHYRDVPRRVSKIDWNVVGWLCVGLLFTVAAVLAAS